MGLSIKDNAVRGGVFISDTFRTKIEKRSELFVAKNSRFF